MCIRDRSTPVVALVDDLQVFDEVPMEDKDVAVDVIITPTKTIRIRERPRRPEGISWERLPERVIRRVKPLWELFRKGPHFDSP